jgi:hypothetical protein
LGILAVAIAAACWLTLPALADDDGWEADDRISPTVEAQADKETATDGVAVKPAQAQPAPKLTKAEKAKQKAAQDAQAQQAAAHQQDDADAAAQREQARQANLAPSVAANNNNVLGPLWGVPTNAPVMKDLDPELEKRYAKDHQGRLVPKSEETAAPAKTPSGKGAAGRVELSTDPSSSGDASAADPAAGPDREPAPSKAKAAGTDPYAGLQQSEVKGDSAQPKLRKEGKHKFFKNPFKKKKKGPKQPKQPKEVKQADPKPEKEPKAEAPKEELSPEDAKKQADEDKRMRRETDPAEKGW